MTAVRKGHPRIFPYPMATVQSSIEQDLDRLLAISKFTFDLSNADFVRYFISRTGQLITDCECGWNRVCELVANPPDMSWKITRAKLQNCWDLYHGSAQKAEPAPVPVLVAEPIALEETTSIPSGPMVSEQMSLFS